MDQQLLAQIRHGNKSAFAQVVEQLQHPLFSYLGRMGLEQTAAEDIAQETFVRAWQARERFDAAKSAYSTWIFTIARRLAINELGRSWRQREVAETSVGVNVEIKTSQQADDTSDLPQHLTTPIEQLQQQELQQRLEKALATLPVQERSLVALAYLSELELADIASIENIPTGTVKSRLHRIRSKLKTLIGSLEHE